MFNKINIELDGFRSGKFYLRELSIKQLRDVMQYQNDDIDMLLNALKHALYEADGNKVVTDDYSLDQLSDDLPQRYVQKLADAYAELNNLDELDTAKK